MKKEEMVSLLRSAGVDENAVNLAINAWEMGAEFEREECLKIKDLLHPMNFGGKQTYTTQELLDHMETGINEYANMIKERGEK